MLTAQERKVEMKSLWTAVWELTQVEEVDQLEGVELEAAEAELEVALEKARASTIKWAEAEVMETEAMKNETC